MEEILRAILRQLVISNQMKVLEFAKDPLKTLVYADEIKVWNEAIKFEIDNVMDD